MKKTNSILLRVISISSLVLFLASSILFPVTSEAVAATVSSPVYGIAAGGGLTGMSQTALNSYFSGLKTLGTKWVRWDIAWSEVQPNSATSFNWTAIDRVNATAKKYGINQLGIITYTPEWARMDSCKSDWQCAPADSAAFAKFAGIVALRYKSSIVTWEIWNEPNITVFWGPTPDVSRYADLLKKSYAEIKRVNPSAFVLSAGLSPAPDEGGNIAPLTFIKGLYANNAIASCDAVAFHPYTYPALPTYVADWNSWQQMISLRKLMVEKGDSAKKVWVTEFGAPTGGSGVAFASNQLDNFNYGADYLSETGQANILSSALTFYKANTSWIGAFFSYSLKDNGTDRSDTENFYGLTRYNGTKKPAYTVYQKAIASSLAL